MDQPTLPPDATALLHEVRSQCSAYMNAVMFLALDASRDRSYGTKNLLVLAIEDHLEASIALPELAERGLVNTCRRELRFLLEASMKLCYAERSLPSATIDDKLATLRRQLDSPHIGLRRQLTLDLLPETEREPFAEFVGRLYGEASTYVHLTHAQVLERDRLAKLGGQTLRPTSQSLAPLLALLSGVLAASFVYVAHSVPAFAVGDHFVEDDGSSHSWPLAASRWVALLDEHFDYKHERQASLTDIRKRRWSAVAA
jgi:hypothetical protein